MTDRSAQTIAGNPSASGGTWSESYEEICRSLFKAPRSSLGPYERTKKNAKSKTVKKKRSPRSAVDHDPIVSIVAVID